MSDKTQASAKTAKKRRGLSYERRKALYGYGFISLWLVGTVLFFLIPLGKSLWYSFSDVSIDPGAVHTRFTGVDNYFKVVIGSHHTLILLVSHVFQ